MNVKPNWKFWGQDLHMKLPPVPWRTVGGRAPLFLFLFGFVMIVTNYGWFEVWENTLPRRAYLNTDDIDGYGYLNPGGWVGSHGTWPVVTLKQLNQDPSMNDPDELKEGWSITRLLVVWWCMFGPTVIVSVWLAALPWVNLASKGWRIRTSHKLGIAALALGLPCMVWLFG